MKYAVFDYDSSLPLGPCSYELLVKWMNAGQPEFMLQDSHGFKRRIAIREKSK